MAEEQGFEAELARGDDLAARGLGNDALAAWRLAAAGVRQPGDVWKLAKRFRAGEGDPSATPCRIALLGDATLDFQAAHLEVALHRELFTPALYVAPFGQWAQEILDPASGLHAFDAELVIVDVHGESLFPGLYGSAPAPRDDEERALDEYAQKLRSLASRAGFVLAHGFVVPDRPVDGAHARWTEGGSVRRIQRMNECLASDLSDLPNVRILDADAFAARVGKERVRNRKLWHLGKVPVDERFLGALADEYLRVVKPLKGRNRRVLVLDLDGTLWGGVLGELGPDGIALETDGPGAPFVDFQRAAHRLFQRGVALAISSKNNEADVLPVLRDHPAMVLREESFAARRIGWGDKVQSLIDIADEIGVGLDALAFLDDNPVERENVRMRLPEVLVPELPEDPVDRAGWLESLTDFDPLHLTAEDRSRGRMYAEEARRRRVRQDAPDLNAYLGTLETVISVRIARSGEMDRVHQLMGKTNQFNTTTLRWDLPEIERFAAREATRVHVARVRDRFGDSGLVGVCLSRRDGDRVEVEDFLLSCRVLGRGVEDAFLRCVLGMWREAGVRSVAGSVVFTPRNPPARGLFEGSGLRKVHEDVDGMRFEADLADVNLEAPEWIRVEGPSQSEVRTA